MLLEIVTVKRLVNRLVSFKLIIVLMDKLSEQEGVKKGQKLLAISSPMQSGAAGEMWTVNKRPSLRFVQDAVRMNRSGSITLELTEEALLSSAKISNDASMSLMDSMEGKYDNL